MKIRVTRAVTAPFRKLTGFGRRFASFNRGALLVVLAVILLGGMTTAEYLQQDAEQPPAISQQTADQEKPKEETPANIQTNAPPTDTPQPTTPKSTNPSASTPSTPKSLKITPTSFTAKAGENLQLTIQSSDGKGINYPFFAASTNGNFLFNFTAGPAKATWNGPISVAPNAPVGTYTLNIAAQDNRAVYYRGTITVTIVKPTMEISIQSLGYDANDDALLYRVTIHRLYGFEESITDISAYSATEPGFGCYYVEVDDSTVTMACGHDNEYESRPTNGTLSVEISTASLNRSTSASYSLPPL